MIFHNPYLIIKCTDIPLSLSFSRSCLITVGFAVLIFTALMRISALYPKSRPLWELSRLGELKLSYEEKLSRMPGLPYLSRRENSRTRIVLPPETGSRS